MDSLTFEYEWENGEGITAPELRFTLARLAIRVNDEFVTRVYDERARSVRDHVYVSLYPLAEWLATNWYPLLYETTGWARPNASRRHLLLNAGEGFVLPRLLIQPEGDCIELDWDACSFPYSEFSFLSSGTAHVSREQVEREFIELIQATVSRLADCGLPYRTLLEDEWEALNALDSEEKAFCRTVGALGLDPFSTSEEVDNDILSVAKRVPESLRTEFFASVPFQALGDDLGWVQSALDLLAGCEGGTELSEVRRSIRERTAGALDGPPWKLGYRYARSLRQELQVPHDPLDERQLGGLGWNTVLVADRESAVLDGISSEKPDNEAGTFVVTGRREDSRRFCFARGLYEYLSSTAFPRLVTDASTYTQKASRAFAAELLAPAEAIRQRIKGGTVSQREVEDMSTAFAVSTQVIEHQVRNHELACLPWDWATRYGG
ncbi:MAG TPA: hypothetical protein ENN80_08070 [Candidatus Hydrogenedentes bacterium]|nr:hypothetical protein [Candidatus Hydrogenedentota bacterium]